MLDKLKTDLDTIIELVNKVPAALQETALKTILEAWFNANLGPKFAPASPPQPPPTTGLSGLGSPGGVPGAVKPFLTAQGITTETLEKVFHPAGPGAQLLASTLPGTGKSAKLVSLSILLCVKQALESGAFICTLQQLRELAVHYDCYDSTNFAKTLKGKKSYFKPRERSSDLELSGPGMKKAGEIIKSLAAEN